MSVKKLRSHFSYLVLALMLHFLLVFAIAYVNDWYEQPFSLASDLNVHLSYAFKLSDPRLFSRDPALKLYDWRSLGRLDVLPFPLLLSALLPILGGIRLTLIALSLLLGLVFVVGVYGLTYSLSGDPLAGVIASFLASLPYWALGGVQLGFLPGSVLPRNFVVAISPIITYLFLRWKERDRLWILYALLGLSVNVHTLSALHLAIILTLTLILTTKISRSMFKRVLLAGTAFTIAALPALVVFVPTLTSVVTVTSEEAQVEITRYAFTLRPSLSTFLIFVLSFLPLAVFGGLGFASVREQWTSRGTGWRGYLVLCLVVLALPWVGVAINSFTLSFRQLELLRVTRYPFLLSFAPVGMLLSRWLQKRSLRNAILVPVLLVVLVVLSRPQVSFAIVKRGYRWFGAAQGMSTEPDRANAHLQMTWDWAAFSDLCRWVDSNTAIDAMFLAPADWNSFWVYARRGMAVAWKGAGMPGWSELYALVQELYRRPQAEQFVEVARQYDADYVIVAEGLVLPELERVYYNKHYAIYKVGEPPG
jgi:hypothetical protein